MTSKETVAEILIEIIFGYNSALQQERVAHTNKVSLYSQLENVEEKDIELRFFCHCRKTKSFQELIYIGYAAIVHSS